VSQPDIEKQRKQEGVKDRVHAAQQRAMGAGKEEDCGPDAKRKNAIRAKRQGNLLPAQGQADERNQRQGEQKHLHVNRQALQGRRDQKGPEKVADSETGRANVEAQALSRSQVLGVDGEYVRVVIVSMAHDPDKQRQERGAEQVTDQARRLQLV
jgi:hypothetical protein